MKGHAISSAPVPAGTLVLIANQAWNLVNYRSGLIQALRAEGYDILAVAPPEPQMEARLLEMGCRFTPIPLDAKGLSPLGEARTLFALWRLLRRERPRAMLSWTIKANLWGALAARITAVPALVNVSGLGTAQDYPVVLRKLVQLLYRVCFERVATVFFQNANDRAELVDARLVDETRTVLLPGSGIDLDHFTVPSGGRPPLRRYLLSGRLLAPKGIREFAAVAARMRHRRPELRFTVLGFLDVANATAIPRHEVESWVADGTIEYLQPVEDVRDLLASAEAVVLPSYYREGLSRALLEAAAMGRPVITTDHPGCREAVVDGVTGFLCQPRDIASLEAAIERLAALDDAQWARMGAAARARIEAEFSLEKVKTEYLAALARAGVTGSTGGPPSGARRLAERGAS